MKIKCPKCKFVVNRGPVALREAIIIKHLCLRHAAIADSYVGETVVGERSVFSSATLEGKRYAHQALTIYEYAEVSAAIV